MKQTVEQSLPCWFLRIWQFSFLLEALNRRPTLTMLTGVFLFSVIAWRPLLAPEYPVTFDGDLHVIRSLHLERELRAGQFPARWGSEQNGGYGYPTFNFYYQLPYYAAVGLHQVGLSMASAIKLLMGMSLLGGGLLLALWVRSVWGALGGFVAGVLFVLSPALLQASYLILAVGELVAIGLLPGVLWALHEGARRPRSGWLLFWVAGLLLALTVLSHNLLGIFALGTVGLYGLMLSVQRWRWWPLVGTGMALSLALGLAAYFWLPGLVELKYTAAAYPGAIRFNPPLELLDISLGPPRENQGAYNLIYPREMMGPPILSAMVLAVLAYLALRERLSREQETHLLFSAVLALGTVVLLVMPLRDQVWHTLPLLKHAQYASRLLLLLAFAGAALGGAVVVWTRWRIGLTVLLAGLAVPYGIAFAQPATTEPVSDDYFRGYWQQTLGAADWGTPIMPIWGTREVSPRARTIDYYPPTTTIAVLEGEGEILEQSKRSTHIRVRVRAVEPLVVRFSTLYFPGWQAVVDSLPAPIDIVDEARSNATGTKLGTIGVAVPPGEREVHLQFVNTPVRRLGNSITVASAVLTVISGGAFAVALARTGRAKKERRSRER